jgi:hypothetical protein
MHETHVNCSRLQRRGNGGRRCGAAIAWIPAIPAELKSSCLNNFLIEGCVDTTSIGGCWGGSLPARLSFPAIHSTTKLPDQKNSRGTRGLMARSQKPVLDQTGRSPCDGGRAAGSPRAPARAGGGWEEEEDGEAGQASSGGWRWRWRWQRRIGASLLYRHETC